MAVTPDPTAFDRDFVYRIEILEVATVAVMTSGDATVSGWARLHDGLRADPRVKRLPLLIDYTGLDATFLTIGDVRLIGESVAALDRHLHPPRRAVVVTSGFEFGLTRMCHHSWTSTSKRGFARSDHARTPSPGSPSEQETDIVVALHHRKTLSSPRLGRFLP